MPPSEGLRRPSLRSARSDQPARTSTGVRQSRRGATERPEVTRDSRRLGGEGLGEESWGPKLRSGQHGHVPVEERSCLALDGRRDPGAEARLPRGGLEAAEDPERPRRHLPQARVLTRGSTAARAQQAALRRVEG